ECRQEPHEDGEEFLRLLREQIRAGEGTAGSKGQGPRATNTQADRHDQEAALSSARAIPTSSGIFRWAPRHWPQAAIKSGLPYSHVTWKAAVTHIASTRAGWSIMHAAYVASSCSKSCARLIKK